MTKPKDTERLVFDPDWRLPAAPEGEDEPQVQALFVREMERKRQAKIVEDYLDWEHQPEWLKEAWRREYRKV